MRLFAALFILLLLIGLTSLDISIGSGRPGFDNNYNDSAVVALAGEFRTVFANLLWIKAEQYHHEYTACNPDWTKNQDVLGLDRLITKLDPHFEEAYAAGARMLIGENKLREARNFLEDGIRNNPESFMLHEELGTLLARHLKDYHKSLFHLKRARILSKDNYDRKRLARLIKTVSEMNDE